MLAKRPEISGFYEFGPFVLDPAERLLTKNGTPVSLAPKAFNLLVVLVENSGSLVTKDKLIETVWEGASIGEGSIPYHVLLVRKALEDGAGTPRYVATVSKQGYRFIAPVKGPLESSDDKQAVEIESGSSYVSEVTPPATAGLLLKSPLRNHLWHLLAVSVLYALYYSVAFMLEVAYEFGAYRTRALNIVPLVFLWVMGTSLVALGGGLSRTSKGFTLGVLFSLSIFIGAALTLYFALILFLPNIAITKASFQTYPAQGAFFKSVYYVLPLVVLFVVLPSHFIVAKERELLNRRWSTRLEVNLNLRSPPGVLGITYLKTWWLAVILLGAFCAALLGTAHLFENLQDGPHSGLFMQLAQWRFLLYFLLGLECVLWYQHRLRRLQ